MDQKPTYSELEEENRKLRWFVSSLLKKVSNLEQESKSLRDLIRPTLESLMDAPQ